MSSAPVAPGWLGELIDQLSTRFPNASAPSSLIQTYRRMARSSSARWADAVAVAHSAMLRGIATARSVVVADSEKSRSSPVELFNRTIDEPEPRLRSESDLDHLQGADDEPPLR